MKDIELATGLQSARINTAGAYVIVNGYYLFTVGIQPHNGHIPIVRLGGHREEYETGWQCAVREVYEEANLHITPLLPQTTYVSNWDHIEGELQEIQWQNCIEQEPIPILVVTYCRGNTSHLSIMYMTHTEGLPSPSSEVKGLLLLTPEEIHYLCRKSLTLEQYLSGGGKAILNTEFDTKLVLEPFAQLRLLSRILRIRSQNNTTSCLLTLPK